MKLRRKIIRSGLILGLAGLLLSGCGDSLSNKAKRIHGKQNKTRVHKIARQIPLCVDTNRLNSISRSRDNGYITGDFITDYLLIYQPMMNSMSDSSESSYSSFGSENSPYGMDSIASELESFNSEASYTVDESSSSFSSTDAGGSSESAVEVSDFSASESSVSETTVDAGGSSDAGASSDSGGSSGGE